MAVKLPTLSPSRLSSALMCGRQARLNSQHGQGPPGAPALIGSLVHRVLEIAAECGGKVGPSTFLRILAAETPDYEIGAAAGLILADMDPVDFSRTIETEKRFSDHVKYGFRYRGIIDRIDQRTPSKIRITDYKSGACKTRAELEGAAQTLVYLSWAVEEYGTEDVTMIYHYVSAGISIKIGYDEEKVEAGLSRAGDLYRAFLDDENPEPTMGDSCAWCSHKAGCSIVEAQLEGVAYPTPWDGLGMTDLVALRQQVAGDAKMLESARKGIDKTILGKLNEDEVESWAPAGSPYSVKITSRSSKKVLPAALPTISKSLGIPLLDLVERSCSISAPKLTKLVKGNVAAEGALSLNTTKQAGAKFLKVTSKGGLL